MTTITKSGEQCRITIPKEIIKLMKWVGGTELIFIPEIEKTGGKLSKDTPLKVMEVK